MSGPAVIDTNLLLLFVIGLADPRLIAAHKRTRSDFTTDDFDLLGLVISGFTDIVLIPNVLTEVSNLARQIADPAKSRIQAEIRRLTQNWIEVPIASLVAAQRDEFIAVGLTDAAILQLCSLTIGDARPTLLSIDQPLISRARTLGHTVLNYREL